MLLCTILTARSLARPEVGGDFFKRARQTEEDWIREMESSKTKGCKSPVCLGYNGITVISDWNRMKSATLSVKILRRPWNCIVATMFAS